MKHICLILSAIAAICGTAFGQAIRPISYNASNNLVVGSTNTNPFTFSNSFAWSTNTLAGTTRTNLALGWSALTNTNAATSFLGFTTNGQVVANTGTNLLTFTNDVKFGGGDLTVSGQVISGSGVSFSFEDANFAYGATLVREQLGFNTNLNTLWTATNASNARSAVGLGATWLTNTNVTNFRSAIGLGATNAVEFSTVSIGGSGQMYLQGSAGSISFYDGIDSEIVLEIPADANPVVINGQWNDSNVRSNLGLPLSALTNTSNVTMMRALSGSTNTNHPYSGSISVVGTNNTNTLVFSNGVLQSVQ